MEVDTSRHRLPVDVTELDNPILAVEDGEAHAGQRREAEYNVEAIMESLVHLAARWLSGEEAEMAASGRNLRIATAGRCTSSPPSGT